MVVAHNSVLVGSRVKSGLLPLNPHKFRRDFLHPFINLGSKKAGIFFQVLGESANRDKYSLLNFIKVFNYLFKFKILGVENLFYLEILQTSLVCFGRAAVISPKCHYLNYSKY
jgi:hypothetical protein